MTKVLDVEIAGIKLRNPLMLASGVVGSNPLLYRRAWEEGAGAIVTKTFTVEKREGNISPIIIGVPCGYINAVGLENPGIEYIEKVVRFLKSNNIATIVSIAGRTIDEFLRLALKSRDCGADAIELNLSCPHVRGMGMELGHDGTFVVKLIRSIKEEVDIPIFPKFGYSPRLTNLLKLAEIAGADGVVIINTIRSMRIDVWIHKPVLSNKYGGLSGPAIHPIAVSCVYEAYEVLDIPIIASGGAWSWEDVIEFILAGARAVQIGSIIGEKGLNVFREILQGIERYLKENNLSHINRLVGLAHIDD